MVKFGRFRILETLAEGKVGSYRAHDPVGNAVVLLHIGDSEINEMALAHPESVREHGQINGIYYLLAPNSQEFESPEGFGKGSASGKDDLLQGKRWKMPALPNEPNPAPAPETMPGGFTQLFQAVGAESKKVTGILDETMLMPAINPPPASPSEPDAPQPGAFTQLFSAPVSQPATPVHSAGQVPRVPTVPADRRDQIAPGKTVIFEAKTIRLSPGEKPVTLDSAAPATSPTPAKAEPGEFTRMFAAPVAEKIQPPPENAGPGESIAKSPAVEPGEFTKIFRQPPASEPIAPRPESPKPPVNKPEPPIQASHEFTKAFESPLPQQGREIDFQAVERNPIPPPQPTSRAAGEFTQMFGRPLGSEAAAPRASAAQNNATVLFQAPQKGNAPPVQQGASEFTQMFGKPAMQSAPAATPKTGPAAQAANEKKGPPVGALVLIFAALLVMVIVLVLFLVLRR